MKTMKKSLCMILSILMVFCSVPFFASAEDGKNETVSADYGYSLKYYANKPDSYGAGKLLDEVEKGLADADIHEEIAITDNIKFVIDLRSVNALCGTLDDFADLLDNLLIQAAIAVALGDLKELDFSTWKTGMTRSSKNDTTIIKELVEFVNANSTVISGIVDGTLDLGLLNDTVDIKGLLGEDGVSGLVKEAMFDIVYDGAELDAAYEQYKNDVDGFVYGPLHEKLSGDYLKDFKVTADTTVEDLLIALINAAVKQYAIPGLEDINEDLASSEVADLRALAPYLNLNGSTYNLSGLVLDTNKGLLSQMNDFVGVLASQIIPGYDWKDGDYTTINENIEAALKYLGTASGLVANAAEMSFDEIVMEVIGIVLRNLDLGSYEDGVTECDTLEEMLKVVLINAARDMDITYTYTEKDSWLVVWGDIFAVWAYDNFDIKDLDGNPYRGGKGDEVWTVANYFVNYFLFDKSMANFLGLDVEKTDSFFTKMDKLIDYFGETKTKGVDFSLEKFLLGDGTTKGLLDSVFTLDIENILAITAEPALETAGDVKAAQFLYNTVRYLLNNWAVAEMLPAYKQATAFTNALSNENIAKLVQSLLKTLSTRRTSLTTIIAFASSLIFEGEPDVVGTFSASAEDAYYTGKAVYPDGAAAIGENKLVQGQDFIVVSESTAMGSALAEVKLIGIYDGSVTVPFNILLAPVGDVAVATTDTQVSLSWDAVPGADRYNVYMGGNLVDTIAADAELTKQFTELTPVTEYSFSVEAVSDVYGASKAAEVTALTAPTAVTGVKVTSVTDSTATISWNEVPGATGYVVERYSSSKRAYVSAGKTSGTSYTVKGLYSYTGYYFRVKAYVTDDDNTVYSSASAKVYTRTKLGKVQNLEAADRTSSTITLTWDKVRNAKGYRVEQYIGGKWTKLANVTANTYKVTGLKASTRYAFRVRAYYNSKVYGEYSSNLWVYTKLPRVTGVKTSSATASSIKVSWNKVSGATSYVLYRSTNGKSWTKVTTVTGTSATASKLYSGMTYQFKVVAYSNKIKSYGDYSSIVKAKTLVGKVDNLEVTSRKKTSISLSWDKERGAAGYVVYRSTDGKRWTKVATTTRNYVTASSLTKNTTYQFKVRAYQKISDKTVYGSYSSVVKGKTRLF